MIREKSKKNLRPIKPLSHEEAVEQGRRGGKKSVEARREKKLMSQIYAELLAKKHKVGNEEITGDNLLEKVALRVLARGDASSVSLMKEIREATEGLKIFTGINITDNEKVQQVLKEFGISKSESKD